MDIYQKIQELKSNNQEFVICIVTDTKGSVPGKAGFKMLVLPDKTIFGTIGGGNIEFQAIEFCPEVLEKGLAVTKKYKLEEDLSMACGGMVELYFEPVHPKIQVNIFGAGHIGKTLARYATELGFKIMLIDNRDGIFDENDIPGVTFINDEYLKAIGSLSFNARTFSVILTHKHLFDEEILRTLAQKPFAYLGMIGSRRKVAEIKQRLTESEVFDEKTIEKIDMPIGIKFNAVTPKEIAISILAKLIDVKNNLTIDYE